MKNSAEYSRVAYYDTTTNRATNQYHAPERPDSTPVCSNATSIGRFGNSGINVLKGPE